MSYTSNTAAKNQPDRLTGALKWANELGKSSLLENKENRQRQWTAAKRQQQTVWCQDNQPWRRATGPQTAAGQQRSAQNALKHGNFSAETKALKALLRVQKRFVAQVECMTWQKIRALRANHATKPRMPTLRDIHHQITAQFKGGALPSPEREAKWLIRDVAGYGEEAFITQSDKILSTAEQEKIEAAAQRRLDGEPLSRIVGVREFWGLEFEVTPDTLDPRPDTETLVEAVLRHVDRTGGRDKPLRIVDLGTGTGCILISLLSELPNATGIAVDLSEETVKVARRNVEKHGLQNRISVVQGDWMEPLEGENFDIIVSNPPYIPNPDVENLSIEVKNHDPILSLVGGNDGLDCYKKIIFQLKTHLNSENRAFLEIGFGQLDDLSRLVDDSNLCLCDSYADIAGIPRVVDICRGDK